MGVTTFDPGKHPRNPAGDPSGRGGKFAPKQNAAPDGSVTLSDVGVIDDGPGPFPERLAPISDRVTSFKDEAGVWVAHVDGKVRVVGYHDESHVYVGVQQRSVDREMPHDMSTTDGWGRAVYSNGDLVRHVDAALGRFDRDEEVFSRLDDVVSGSSRTWNRRYESTSGRPVLVHAEGGRFYHLSEPVVGMTPPVTSKLPNGDVAVAPVTGTGVDDAFRRCREQVEDAEDLAAAWDEVGVRSARHGHVVGGDWLSVDGFQRANPRAGGLPSVHVEMAAHDADLVLLEDGTTVYLDGEDDWESLQERRSGDNPYSMVPVGALSEDEWRDRTRRYADRDRRRNVVERALRVAAKRSRTHGES